MAGERQLSVQEILERELRRSEPDYVVYCPRHYDGSRHDSLNEHFLQFDGPDGAMMAIWVQSSVRQPRDNRIMFSRSDDEGETWAAPLRIAGPQDPDDATPMTSWAFPMVSRSGRIYVLFSENQGIGGWIDMHTGTMSGVYSDDNGMTWSASQDIPMPKSPYDDPEGKIPGEWIVWQKPMRDRQGGYLVGYTHWVNRAVAYYKEIENWTQIESVVEFMRFENIDDDPSPGDLRVRYSAWGEQALRVPYYRDPLMSVAQEPSLVRLPDDRLFCLMRTNSGYIWYSVSQDDGETWCNPRPMLRRDHGRPILQPVCCCPIYQLADGRYVLFHHNHGGDMDARPEATQWPRRPSYVALGEFRPSADQPIWFSASKQFMDNGGYQIDGQRPPAGTYGQVDIAAYPSFTTRGGNNVLWHADRKCFLVGKKVTPEFLADLYVPST